ncbi:MAG: hypothetical protein ACREDM_00635 [Methylocella sp.]
MCFGKVWTRLTHESYLHVSALLRGRGAIMQDTDVLDRHWRDEGLTRLLHRALTFTQAGLVLGRGTLLAEFEKKRLARGLALDGDEARVLSLLTAAHDKPVAEGVVEKIRRAAEFWCAGEKALAQIHLAFTGLPKIDEADAYRLFLARVALEKGLEPGDLMKALGFPRAARDLEKYNPDQPSVPPGSGRESGEWTTDGSLASTSADEGQRVQLAGEVIHVGLLTDFFVIHGPDGIPRTFCQYRSAFGYFERNYLGIVECPGIWPVR